MRWPAWLRGEPPEPGSHAGEDARARVPRVGAQSVLAWWFAGGAYSSAADAVVGTVHLEHGTPEPGRRGLHASPSVIAALAHTQSARLCRVRLGGTIARAGDQLAATERTIVASTDATEPLRALTARWIDRALAAAMEDVGLRDPSEHRALAQSARERVVDAEERLRDAQWVLEEGAGRAGGAAQARALGNREGARRAVQEARAAAYAHEAAAQLAGGSDVRSIARAIELVIEALVTFERDPEAHAAVRAELDREIEDELREPLAASTEAAPSSDDPYEEVEPLPAPHRGEGLIHAIERALAPHTGVRGVHPLVLDDAVSSHVSLVLRCDTIDAARSAVEAIDQSAELGPLGVQAIAVWGTHQRGVVSRALQEASEVDEDRMRPSWIAAIRDALAHPALARDRDALVRAWLVREPDVASAVWIDGDVLGLRFQASLASARELLARIASHYPLVCGRVERQPLEHWWLATRGALGALRSEGVTLRAPPDGPPVYTKSCGLADPVRSVARRVPGPLEPLPSLWSSPRTVRTQDLPAQTPELDSEQSTWVKAVGRLPGAAAWALGGDADLALRMRGRGVFPVAVIGDGHRGVSQVILAADAAKDLGRFSIGILAVPRWRTDSLRPVEIGLDRRLRNAVDEASLERLLGCVRDSRPQPLVKPLVSDSEGREMELRWQLASIDAVERASWIYGPWAEHAVLAVLVRVRSSMERVETAITASFPMVSVVQVCSAEPVLATTAVQIDRVWRGAKWDLVDDPDMTKLAPAAAEALADPDVYARKWMLAAPPDPFRNTVDSVAVRRRAERGVSPRSAPPPGIGRPTARCPRCEVQYCLPFDTPLDQTRCGLCNNSCLVPVGERRSPYLGSVSAARELRCPACDRTTPMRLTDGAVHARCMHCRAAVLPVRPEDGDGHGD